MRSPFYYKMRQIFYYKMQQVCYKMRQLLEIAMILLQNTTVITKCDVYDKLRQYTVGHMDPHITDWVSKPSQMS